MDIGVPCSCMWRWASIFTVECQKNKHFPENSFVLAEENRKRTAQSLTNTNALLAATDSTFTAGKGKQAPFSLVKAKSALSHETVPTSPEKQPRIFESNAPMKPLQPIIPPAHTGWSSLGTGWRITALRREVDPLNGRDREIEWRIENDDGLAEWRPDSVLKLDEVFKSRLCEWVVLLQCRLSLILTAHALAHMQTRTH